MKLEIQNIQSIKHAELDLKGFSVIVGKGNLGKSAIQRAFATVMFNDWKPNYLRHKTTTGKITWTDDNRHIEVIKGSRNTFIVNGVSYDKIGINIPEEYEKFGWTKLSTSNGSYPLQISEQTDPLFMVSYGDVENTRILNSAIKVDVYEEAARLSLYDKRQETSKLSDLTLDKQEITKEINTETKLRDKYNEMKSTYEEMLLIDKYKETIDKHNKIKQIQKLTNDFLTTLKQTEILEIFLDNLYYLEECVYNRAINKKRLKILDKLKQIKEYTENTKEKEELETRVGTSQKYINLTKDLEVLYGYLKNSKSKLKLENNITKWSEYVTTAEEAYYLIQFNSKLNQYNKAVKLKKFCESNLRVLSEIQKIQVEVRLIDEYVNKYRLRESELVSRDELIAGIENIGAELKEIGTCPLCGGVL